MEGSREERRDAGRQLRKVAPRSSHADWSGPVQGRDAIAVLEDQAVSRLPELMPIRYARMAESPFGFLRGAAAVMALDLAATPVTGLHVQACGDAHIRNFGHFATPERNLAFSINDFDETLRAPWEWDVKRLTASLYLVARTHGFSPTVCHDMVTQAAHAYREDMAEYAAMATLELWYDRTDVDDVVSHFPPRYRSRVKRDMKKAQKRDPRGAVAKLTRDRDGDHHFVEDPPLIVHLSRTEHNMDEVEPMLGAYRSTLRDDRQELFDRFRLVDVARKVVGVGSVGTRVWVCLFEGSSGGENDHMILQVKEAQASVLESFVGDSAFDHHGRRVVAGQRVTQGPTDIFLGWCEGPRTGRQYYVRQLWDAKGRSDLTRMGRRELTHHASLCAYALARAHARSGDAVQISGYLGSSDAFDEAIATFAERYANVTEQDHAALLDAIKAGRVTADL
jgi:uncharacterized protein (DUF2252 family)